MISNWKDCCHSFKTCKTSKSVKIWSQKKLSKDCVLNGFSELKHDTEKQIEEFEALLQRAMK